MPAPFIGEFGFNQQRLSGMLQGIEAEESERRRMAVQLAIEKQRQRIQQAQLKMQEEQFKWQQEETERQRTAVAEEAEQERVFKTQQAQQKQLSELLGTEMETRGEIEVAGIEQQTEMEKLYAPEFMQIGNALIFTDPRTGKATEVAYIPKGIVLQARERLVEERTGDVLTESEDVMQDEFYIYGIKGGQLVSRAPKFDLPPGTYGEYTPEGAVDVIDIETGQFIERILTTKPPKATYAQILEAEARGREVEYDYIVKTYEIDAAKEMKWGELDATAKIEAAKRAGEDLDRALEEGRIKIEAGELVLDRNKMLQEAVTEKDRQDLEKYLGDLEAKTKENVEQIKVALGYAGLDTTEFIKRIELASKEKVEWWKITSQEDIATLENTVAWGAIEVTKEGLRVKKSIATMLELKKDERDRLNRELTLQVEGMRTQAKYAGLDMKEIIAKMEQETEFAKIEEKRVVEEGKVAREEIEHLRAHMARATGQIKGEYGMYKPADKVEAAKILLTLIEADMSISPETKARWLAIAPALQGVTMTMAEGIDESLRPEYEQMRTMWEQTLSRAAAETTEVKGEVERFKGAPATLPPTARTYKGLSFEEIQKEVNRIYRETGNRKDVTKYLKKYGMTIDDYTEELRKVTPTE